MARYVSRPQIREGRGLGERFTEILVVLVILAGLGWGAKWYFVDYRNSASFALQSYMGALKAGNAATQYELLADSTKKSLYRSLATYEDRYAPARNFQGRLVDYVLSQPTGSGDSRECDVKVAVRRPDQNLLQTSSDSYTDHYVLTHEAKGWRVVLEKSKIESAKSVSRY